jgi:toxin ParE1/3/4
MAKIIWTDKAINDLENIGNYISQDSFKYAKMTLQRNLKSANLLETYNYQLKHSSPSEE